MENKVNVAELLKDCPKGMELDCTMYDNVQFNIVQDGNAYPIKIDTPEGIISLSKYGCYSLNPQCKCVIFPKGKTTWEGFHRPFKDGDIIYVRDEYSDATFTYVAILKQIENFGEISSHCFYNYEDDVFGTNDFLYDSCNMRFATEKEKQKLFNAIKENGYKWNAETKTLEKLVESRVHEGDWVVNRFGDVWHIDSFDSKNYQVSNGKGNYNYFPISEQDKMHLWTISDAKCGDVVCYKDEISLYKHDIKNCTKQGTTFGGFVYHCGYDGKRFITDSLYSLTEQDKKNIHPATKEQRDLLFQKIKEAGYYWNDETKTLEKLIQPIFKAGNKVRNKNNHNIVFTITSIEEDYYACGAKAAFWFDDQDDYELVPNKFDITTLKPFDKVLVRDSYRQMWVADFFSHNIKESFRGYAFACIGHCWHQCIPFEGNEHLLGKTEDCIDFYKTWE